MFPKVVIKQIKNKHNLYNISYGFADTPFGEIVLGFLVDKNNAVCHLHFVNKKSKEQCVQELQNFFLAATLTENTNLARQVANSIFDDNIKEGEEPVLEVAVQGTAFQHAVWKTLLHVRTGWTRTYSELAIMTGKAKAVRSVGTAVGMNNVLILIPCHRVVSKNGDLKYSGGSEVKRKLLEYESKIIGCNKDL